MAQRQDYNIEAVKLAKAIDIAIEAFIKYPPTDLTKSNFDHTINVYSKWKDAILNPKPKFRKIASLKHSIEEVFTYFQEGNGETVEYFWQQLNKENLDYLREDKLRKIINRGKIKGRLEYDLVLDSLVAARQDGRITEHEAKQLNEMISVYESRGKT